jgi:hypothetical protein
VYSVAYRIKLWRGKPTARGLAKKEPHPSN